MSSLSQNLCLVVGVAVGFFLATYRMPSTFRIDNFSAGPGPLADSVVKRAANDFFDFNGTGMNFMEISHRDVGGPVQTVISEGQQMIRRILSIPDDYEVMYMHGGAHAQFSAVPLNLMGNKKTADYVVTGYWSERSANHATEHVPNVRKVPVTKNNGILPVSQWDLSKDAAYVHICGSETIDGLEFLDDFEVPNGVPLVGDFTSTLLSRKIDISKFGLIYASGGKNLGPAGMTLVIVKKSLVSSTSAMKGTPAILNYFLTATSKPVNSIYNTPPTYNIYMHWRVLKDMEERFGDDNSNNVIENIEKRAIKRSSQVYSLIDNSNGFYRNGVQPKFRSRMSVPLRIGEGDRELENKFIAQAAASGLVQLFGHPVSGGLRITLYYGVEDKSLSVLMAFMNKFATENRAEYEARRNEQGRKQEL